MNFEQVMLNPASEFAHPSDVYREQSLTRDQKIQILRQWEYDARELQVAEEENMSGGSANNLQEILSVLHQLDAASNPSLSSPTKQGGR